MAGPVSVGDAEGRALERSRLHGTGDLLDVGGDEVWTREEREVPGGQLVDRDGPGGLPTLQVGIGAALLGADEVARRDALPRGCGHRGAEHDGRLRAQAVVGAADE